MTPEEKQQLKYCFETLRKLENSSTVPLTIHQALKANIVGDALVSEGIGTAATQTIGLSGDAQNITVPAQPTGTVKVLIGNTIYELLFK